jgi:UDP-N-acetylmuramyl pentapeptide phosphotransferase/UDP-N-acetylglucosamine-1-phosphate transferase
MGDSGSQLIGFLLAACGSPGGASQGTVAFIPGYTGGGGGDTIFGGDGLLNVTASGAL